MDIKELKEYVDAKVKENGRQEITGPILNKVLNSAIDTLNDTASGEVAEAVEKLEDEVTAEATARESADNTLQSAIDAEATARESADTAITTRVAKLEGIPIAKGAGEGALVANNLANTSSGKYSFAEGDVTKAEQRGSHAEGASTTASAIGAHAEGESTTASGRASHSEGYMSTASGKYAHAEGESGKAEGLSSHVEGYNNVASGNYSHAEGASNKATNTEAHAEGYLCTASGSKSHAEGYITEAVGENSHAEGTRTNASGSNSHAEGYGTVTSADNSHAEGSYNEDDTNLLHAVGIGGDQYSRKNAEAIYTDGKKYVKGVGGYDGTKASIASGAKDVATVAGEATAHIANTDNPHKVTASQIGASTPAEVTSAIATHNTASDAHSDIRKEVADCVRKTGETAQAIVGSVSFVDDVDVYSLRSDGDIETASAVIADSAEANTLAVDVIKARSASGIAVSAPINSTALIGSDKAIRIGKESDGYIMLQYQPSMGRLIYVKGPTTEVGTIAIDSDIPYIYETQADIDTLTSAQVAPYYHNANGTISGTLPDGVTKADRFRLEVLPLGDSYVEQRMTVPTNGTVAVYSRVWNGSSWGSWV